MKKRSILVKFSATGLLVFCALFLFRTKETTFPYQKIQGLNSNCPPGFKLNEKNECISQNLYKQYSSSNDPGVGGLKTALPEVREGFSPQEIDLGRYLFFDPVMSGTGTISCATCHNPEKGFSDGLATSIGAKNHKLKRAAPTLWNVAYDKLFLWDGGAHSLEEQLTKPLFSEYEMANTPENLLSTINSIENYRELFAEAFPERDQKEMITLKEIVTSIVAFETTLVSLNSKYDQYAHGYHQALNEKEIEGLNIFRSFVARCAECHTPPLFTNQQIAVIGVPEPDGLPLDPGAQVPYNDSTMRGGFKVPSLRNIVKTAPYMHSGTFATLREAVQFYNDGRGHAVPKGEQLRIHWHIWEPNLTDYEMDRIVDFLQTLTDESFMPIIPVEVPTGLKTSINI